MMTYPADPPPPTAVQQAAESPTLWLSLALGSILIHLVLFIVASIVSTQTAKVALDLEPIAVEFVEPNAAVEQVESSPAIAVSPGNPSSSTPSGTPAQPQMARSQPPAFNQPAEEPFTPLPPVQRKRPFVRPQPQQPKPAADPIQPQPTSPQTSQPQQLNPSNPQERSDSGSNPSQGRAPGSASNGGNGAPGTTESQSPVTSGNRIGQPQGKSVTVDVLDSRQPVADALKQAARSVDREKTVLINYPSALANQMIRLEASLDIEQNGLVVDVKEAKLLSPESGIAQDIVDDIAKQVFISSQWRFEPAQDDPGGLNVKPRRSNLIIQTQIQLP